MLENIKKNRTCRTFAQVEIPKKDMETIITAARYSASARNAQVLRYLYTQDKNRCREVFPYTHWAGSISWNPTPEEAPTAYILICTDTASPSPNHYIDMGLALQNMTLTAQGLGYACCILGAYQKKEVETVLGLPEGYFSYLLLAIGKGQDSVEVIDAQNTDIKYERNAPYHNRVYKLTLEKLLLTSIHDSN